MGMCQCSAVVQTCIGLFQLGICLLFTIIGYAAPYWANYSALGIDINFGLWENCINDDCTSPTDAQKNSKLDAARAFGILGMIASVASIVGAVIFLVKKKSCYLLLAAIMAMVAFLLVMIEFITAVEFVKDTVSDYGYCFGLTLTAFLQAFFGGISFFGARHQHDRSCSRG